MNKEIKCPHCGEIIEKEETGEPKTIRPIVIGAFAGLGVGLVFDYFYFYIGVITDYFSFMPITHLIAGVLLGMLVGWVIRERKGM